MTRSRILCLALLGALATRLCSSFTAVAATYLPVRLNSTEPNEQQVVDFAISPDSQWVVYEAHSQKNGVAVLFRRPISGSDWSIQINHPSVKGSTVQYFSISPDGSHVFYTADQDTLHVTELYSRPLDGI